MPKKIVPFAIAYDFDGTLAPGNMQEHDFVPQIGMKPKHFWSEVERLSKKHDADNILVYMNQMVEKARAAEVPVRRKDFEDYGKSLVLFKGVDGWFDRIDSFGKKRSVRVEHYIISSGIREMIQGSRISNKFRKIFASSYIYDANGVAQWPALALNYTTKTQYLFRINKGSLRVYDHSKINNYVPKHERPVPFENMIFIGDGETDIPCFRLVKDQGGHSVAVYKPNTPGAKAAGELLIKQGRVNFVCPADYSAGRALDKRVKAIIEKIAADGALVLLGKR